MRTFEQLKELTYEELLAIRDKVRDQLAEKQHYKYTLIGQIMFYETLLDETTRS